MDEGSYQDLSDKEEAIEDKKKSRKQNTNTNKKMRKDNDSEDENDGYGDELPNQSKQSDQDSKKKVKKTSPDFNAASDDDDSEESNDSDDSTEKREAHQRAAKYHVKDLQKNEPHEAEIEEKNLSQIHLTLNIISEDNFGIRVENIEKKTGNYLTDMSMMDQNLQLYLDCSEEELPEMLAYKLYDGSIKISAWWHNCVQVTKTHVIETLRLYKFFKWGKLAQWSEEMKALLIDEQHIYSYLAVFIIFSLPELTSMLIENIRFELNLKVALYWLVISLNVNHTETVVYFLSIFHKYLAHMKNLSDYQYDRDLEKLLKDTSCVLRIMGLNELMIFDTNNHIKIRFSTDILKEACLVKTRYFDKIRYFSSCDGFTVAKVTVEEKFKEVGSGFTSYEQFWRIYKLYCNNSDTPSLIAYQENSKEAEISIYKYYAHYEQYLGSNFGLEFLGRIEFNMTGLRYMLLDWGLSNKSLSFMPENAFLWQRQILTADYETRIIIEQPSKFTINLADRTAQNKVSRQFTNLSPKWNEAKDCYELNFFGEAKGASSKNFIIIDKSEEKLGEKADYYLIHGKHGEKVYNIHFRSPLNDLTAFTISLISMIKKNFS